MLIIIIIIIIIINCNLVVTRWQWLFYVYTKYEIVRTLPRLCEFCPGICLTTGMLCSIDC